MHHLRLVHSVPASRPTGAAQAAAADFYSCGDGGSADVACEDGGVEPEVRILLEHVRRLTPLPNVVRARALGRARAALAAAAPDSTMAPRAHAPRPTRATLLVAAVLALAVGTTTGALLAHRSNAMDARPRAAASSPIAASETGPPRDLPGGPRRAPVR